MDILLVAIIVSVLGSGHLTLGLTCSEYESANLPSWIVNCADHMNVKTFGCLFKPEYRVVEHTKVLIEGGCITPILTKIYWDEGGDTVYYTRLYCENCGTVKLPYIKPEIGKGRSINQKTGSSDSDDNSDYSSNVNKRRSSTGGARHGNTDSRVPGYNSDRRSAQRGYDRGRSGTDGRGDLSNVRISDKHRGRHGVKYAPSSESENDSNAYSNRRQPVQDSESETSERTRRRHRDKKRSGKSQRPGNKNGSNVNVKVNVKVNS